MKKTSVTLAFLAVFSIFTAAAHADLDIFLSNLNVEARADLGDFNLRLSSQFNVPLPRVQAVVSAVDNSADAFMCLQLSSMTNRPPEEVVQTYKARKGQGWGVIAKDLGIKPGSAEFHALKSGNFELKGGKGGKGGKGNKGGGGGHGKGHGKGKH